jgi:hypothetical protein
VPGGPGLPVSRCPPCAYPPPLSADQVVHYSVWQMLTASSVLRSDVLALSSARPLSCCRASASASYGGHCPQARGCLAWRASPRRRPFPRAVSRIFPPSPRSSRAPLPAALAPLPTAHCATATVQLCTTALRRCYCLSSCSCFLLLLLLLPAFLLSCTVLPFILRVVPAAADAARRSRSDKAAVGGGGGRRRCAAGWRAIHRIHIHHAACYSHVTIAAARSPFRALRVLRARFTCGRVSGGLYRKTNSHCVKTYGVNDQE